MLVPKQIMDQTRKIVVIIWILIGAYLLTLLDWYYGGLRLANNGADILAKLVALWFPVVCLILLGFLPRSQKRRWTLIGAVPLILLSLPVSAFVGMNLTILRYTRQSSVRIGSSEIVTYFEDCGAWDNGEVIVQQEMPLLPGLLLVRPLSRQECLRDMQIRVINRHYIECDYVADHADTNDPSPEARRDEAWVF